VPPTGPPPAAIPSPSRGEVAEADKPAWARGLVLPDLPLRWYPRVTGFLELYRGDPRYRNIMRGWLTRMPLYRAAIERVLAREGLPPGLVFVSMIESGFTAGALSSKGAGGFWQFLPDVARGYGLEVSFWVDERRDVERSTAAAALYLDDLHDRFGTWELALAGFNAGHYAVVTSIQRFNTNDFWTLCQLESGLPWETTEYVPKVLAVGIVERNRAAFGFGDVPVAAPPELETVNVPAGVSFDTIATRLGITDDELASYNGGFIRRRTPPDRGPSLLRIPKGKTVRLDNLRPGDLVTVKVRPGETLARIARARRIARDRLRQINGVTDESDVTPGTVILVPRPASKTPARPAKAPAKRKG
jgi:membrane-bound lytic murein transglycosylase D